MSSERKTGIVKQLDPLTGVGEITSLNESYLFLMEDALDKSIQIGSEVSFRAETIHNQRKAFFIKKIEQKM